MMRTINVLAKRAECLESLIEMKRASLQNAPSGRLTIDAAKRKPQYYRTERSESPHYISKKDMDLIRALAQKDYDKRVFEAAENELRLVKKFMSRYPTVTAEQIFDQLRPERQALITPIIETKEEMIRKWREEVFETNPMPVGDTGLETDRGEIVRTRAEYIIANDFNRAGAEYHYEKALYLKGWGTVYPDFTILNVRTGNVYFWEPNYKLSSFFK